MGSITPPEPTRILDVAAARCAISTAGAELAIAGMLWCSATQNRRYRSSSVRRASSVVWRSAWPDVVPAATGERSRTDSGTSVTYLGNS